jgi:hypothetical protein
MSIPIFHTSDDVVCRMRKKQTQNPPSPHPSCSVIRRYVTYSSSQCALISQKYAQTLRHFMLEFPLIKFNCYGILYNANMATDICLERSKFRFGKRIEVCITRDTLLSKDWTIFIIDISNALFNTEACVTK